MTSDDNTPQKLEHDATLAALTVEAQNRVADPASGEVSIVEAPQGVVRAGTGDAAHAAACRHERRLVRFHLDTVDT